MERETPRFFGAPDSGLPRDSPAVDPAQAHPAEQTRRNVPEADPKPEQSAPRDDRAEAIAALKRWLYGLGGTEIDAIFRLRNVVLPRFMNRFRRYRETRLFWPMLLLWIMSVVGTCWVFIGMVVSFVLLTSWFFVSFWTLLVSFVIAANVIFWPLLGFIYTCLVYGAYISGCYVLSKVVIYLLKALFY